MNGATRKLIVVSLFLISLSLVLSGGTAVAASSVGHTTLTIHGKPGRVVAPGTVITITGHPMKDGTPAAAWIDAVRADGKRFDPRAGFQVK